jgi:ribosomal protein S18 acetylase RimI-like enzyme
LLPDYRNKGIGSLLVAQLLEGVDAASLSCDPANPARRLYIRLGFAPLEDGRTMLRVKSATA